MEIKEIPGFPGYFVSDTGLVFSDRLGGRKERKLQTSDRGYRMVEIRTAEGKPYFKTVHRLVALTFLPNPENKPVVNHKNGIKTDNRVDNLEWCTYSENMTHAVETGLLNTRGENNNLANLTELQVREICELLQDTDLSGKQIMKITGVCDTVISKIRRGVTWRHVSSEYQIEKPKSISSKLGEDQVREICFLINEGTSYSEITRLTGVKNYAISKINLGHTYKEISNKYLHATSKTIESTSEDGSE